MPTTITSQYMSMPVPVPTVDPGPQYAVDLNSCLTLVDQHDHSTGKGVPITPVGMNINVDLPINNHNITLIRSSRYQVQPSTFSSGSDIGCTYVSGVDLYYSDINGIQVRLTASGAVAGTPGSIANLTPPASVTYVSGTSTFVFQSSSGTTAGNIDAGSHIFRQVLSNAKGITVSSPNSLAADYTLTLPTGLPASTGLLSVSPTGTMDYISTLGVVNGGTGSTTFYTPTTNYTPTFSGGFGTPTTVSCFYRIVGDMVEVFGSFTTGTVASSAGSFSLPSNVTVKRNVTSALGNLVGMTTTAVSNTNAVLNLAGLFLPTSASVVSMCNVANGATNFNLASLNVSSVIGSGTPLSFFARVPINN